MRVPQLRIQREVVLAEDAVDVDEGSQGAEDDQT